MELRDSEPNLVLQNIKEGIDELMGCHVTELEDTLRNLTPVLVKTMQQIYIKNCSIAQSSEEGMLDIIKANFQTALSLTDCSHDILQHLMRNQPLCLSYISTVPLDVAQLLCLTFDHCKNSQKIYSSYYNSITELFDLFKKTQDLHMKYLSFLDTHLVIDFLNEKEVEAYKENIVLNISETLSGLNMKSMADNWKSFLSLVQKPSPQKAVPLNLSLAIEILSREISNNMLSTIDMEPLDAKKCSQNFKVTGFLVKVVLKLSELDLDFSGIYEDIFKFWIMMYSWNDGFFRTNNYPDDIVDPMHALFQLCSHSLPNFISQNPGFLKFCIMHGDPPVSNQNFGFLLLANALIKELPKILITQPTIFTEFRVVSILKLVFRLTQKCYKDYFCDYNSVFYGQLVTNASLATLLFPNQFPEVESCLLESVVKDNVWAALLAIDMWCLVLRYSQESVRRSTLNALIKKIDGLLKSRLFHPTPVEVRLKVLTQRILKMLPTSTKHEEITKYNPTTHLFAWRILNLRNIPLSHRYYVEFLMCDILENMDILERDGCTSGDMHRLLEHLDTISYTKFNDLEMNATRLVPFIINLWSFEMREVSLGNTVFKNFACNLIRITTAVSDELTGENFILILSQLKILSADVLVALLICDLLQTMSKRNFNSFAEKQTLFTLISSLFQNLLAHKNPVLVQLALESFVRISESNYYDSMVHKISGHSSDTRKKIADYIQRKAAASKYNSQYLDKLQSIIYRHRCRNRIEEWQPICKKIKIDDHANVVITKLKEDTEKLLTTTDKSDLSTKQKSDIKYVVSRLETLLN